MAGPRHRNESAARQRHANRLGLAAVNAVVAKGGSIDALRRDPRAAVRARTVAIDEGRDDEVALGEASHLGTDVLDDTDEFVADRSEIVRRLAAVVPEVRTAHT